MQSLRVPTKKDWGDLNDPEVRYGFKLFDGKTVAEADARRASFLVRGRITREPCEVERIFVRLKPVVDLVADRQSFYDADVSIYEAFSYVRAEIVGLRSKYLSNRA